MLLLLMCYICQYTIINKIVHFLQRKNTFQNIIRSDHLDFLSNMFKKIKYHLPGICFLTSIEMIVAFLACYEVHSVRNERSIT